MNDILSKPITIVRAEFISNLTNLINNSGLSPFIIEPILKDIYLEVKGLSQKQYEVDVMKYEESKRKYLNNKTEDIGE